jgi:hypothetical protein
MKKRKKKSQYLSYIEETRKHHTILNSVASSATRDAVSTARAQSLTITYREGVSIVREDISGRKVIVGKIEEPSIKVTKGATIKLR